MTSSTRLLQFSMGLNSEFEMIRGQILILEPLPSVSKAFAMVVRFESEKSVTQSYSTTRVEATAMLAKTSVLKSKYDNKNYGKKKDGGTKIDGFCDHCKNVGHTKETCFKLHGYPDWFKEYKDAKKGGNGSKKVIANMVTDGAIQEGSTEFKKNLYILESKSFDPDVIEDILNCFDSSLYVSNHVLACNAAHSSNYNTNVLWHQRLGHSPLAPINRVIDLNPKKK